MIIPVMCRPGDVPYGSATLFDSTRVGPGSTLTSDFVSVGWSRVRSFGFRGNKGGSWFIDVSFAGTQRVFTLAQGTFPAGFGSVKVASFEEAFGAARGRILNRAGAAGSASMWFGGVQWKVR